MTASSARSEWREAGLAERVRTSAPRTAAWLGALAVLPFVAGAAVAASSDGAPHAVAVRALVGYAAVVASFLGGIHWGFAFVGSEPRTRRLLWGVVPSIVAWLATLAPPSAALAVCAALLVACYAVDRAVYPVHGAAAWLPLRFRLTVLGAGSCTIGAFAG